MPQENCIFDAVPLLQAEQVRTPGLIHLNYTNQDFWSIKQRLVQFCKERFGDQFTDFVESSLAILLLENFAFVGDMLSFKIDQGVNEFFIDTVTEVENAFRLAKLVGFQPTPPVAARAMFSMTIGAALSTDLVIPTPFKINIVSNDTPTTYELFPADENNNPVFDQDVIIPAGEFSNTAVIGVEGATQTQTFSGSGLANQTLTLSQTPVIFDSVRVNVDGVNWTKVDFFTDSQPRREFRVEFNSDYQSFVIFGNNTSGAIPSLGASINVTYRVGGGVIGNIVTGAVSLQQAVSVQGFEISTPIAITNYTKGEFGYDGDGIEEVRAKLPAYIQTQNRVVTGTDIKTFADQYVTPYHGQVGKSTAVLRNYGCAGNVVDLFILAQDGANGLQEASDDLKVDLSNALDAVKMLTDYICIKDGVIIPVDISIEISMDKFYAKFKDEFNTRVQNRVQQFFALGLWDYGQDLRDTDVIKALSDLREINRLEVSFVTADPDNSGNTVTAKYYEIIRLDTVQANFTFE